MQKTFLWHYLEEEIMTCNRGLVKQIMMLPLTGWEDDVAATKNDNCEDYVVSFKRNDTSVHQRTQSIK